MGKGGVSQNIKAIRHAVFTIKWRNEEMSSFNKCNHGLELSKFSLSELWNEIGRRLNIKFGRVQMAFHNGKPSTYANIDLKIKTDEGEEQIS